MRHACSLRVGPIGFRIGSAWPGPVAELRHLYAGYPDLDGGVADYTVRLEPTRPWRRWLRPAVAIAGDYRLPEAAPLPLRHGLLAAEMGMNLQLALGHRRHLLLHAATVERDGRALILTGESGAGKSSLAALLMLRGWRLLGDEFALVDFETGAAHPFPRAISLKEGSIAAIAGLVAPQRFGPLLRATPKGDVRHLIPDPHSLAAMDQPAPPALILFPRFGHASATRPIGRTELFMRLTEASPSYVACGERAFRCLMRLVDTVPATAIDYPQAEAGIAAVEQAWACA